MEKLRAFARGAFNLAPATYERYDQAYNWMIEELLALVFGGKQ